MERVSGRVAIHKRRLAFEVDRPVEARRALVPFQHLELVLHERSMRWSASKTSAHRSEVELIDVIVHMAPWLHQVVVGRRVPRVEGVRLLHHPPVAHVGAKVGNVARRLKVLEDPLVALVVDAWTPVGEVATNAWERLAPMLERPLDSRVTREHRELVAGRVGANHGEEVETEALPPLGGGWAPAAASVASVASVAASVAASLAASVGGLPASASRLHDSRREYVIGIPRLCPMTQVTSGEG